MGDERLELDFCGSFGPDFGFSCELDLNRLFFLYVSQSVHPFFPLSTAGKVAVQTIYHHYLKQDGWIDNLQTQEKEICFCSCLSLFPLKS